MTQQTQDKLDAIARGTYTAEDLSKLLNCTIQHIRNMDSKGAIPGRIKFGRLVRWSKKLVDTWLETPMQGDSQ